MVKVLFVVDMLNDFMDPKEQSFVVTREKLSPLLKGKSKSMERRGILLSTFVTATMRMIRNLPSFLPMLLRVLGVRRLFRS